MSGSFPYATLKVTPCSCNWQDLRSRSGRHLFTFLPVCRHAPSLPPSHLLPDSVDSNFSDIASSHPYTTLSPHTASSTILYDSQHTHPLITSWAETIQRRYLSKQQNNQKTTAAMNIQPPIHDRFIVTPGTTQRDAVPAARKPSLVPGGQPHPVRSHIVAVHYFI